MGVCTNCGKSLDPAWKFCIYCGATVEPTTRAEPIPNAIRPDPTEVAARKRSRVDVPLLIGIGLAAAGAAMIVYLAVLFLLPHA
ncbi:MAG: hypothetical protein JWO10_1983 [Microbacteriaceae bacterium]|nr:hypothetical protein [Microbacteriaceae bacterium]